MRLILDEIPMKMYWLSKKGVAVRMYWCENARIAGLSEAMR